MSSQFKSSVIWSIVNALGSLVVKLGILVVLSRLLGPEEFGIYSVGMAFVLILSVVGQLGIPTSLITVKQEDSTLTGLGLLLGLFSSVVISLIGALIALLFFSDIARSHLVAFSILVVAQVCINILEAGQRRVLKFKLLASNEIVASLIGNGLISLVFALLNFGALSLILGQLGYSAVKLGILFYYAKPWQCGPISKSRVSLLTTDSLAILTAEGANMATVQIQRPIIGSQIGAEAAGLWSRVYQIVLMQLTVVIQPLDNLVLPVLARMQDEKQRRKNSIVAAIQIVGLTTFPGAAATMLLAPLLVPVMFGSAWLDLVLPLQIGSLILFFRGFERVLLSVSRATGTMKVRANVQLCQLAIIVVSLYISAPYGIVIASWAYLISLILGFCITLLSMQLTTGVPVQTALISLLPGIVLATVPLLFGWAVNLFVGLSFASAEVLVSSLVAFLLTLGLIVYKRDFFLEPLVVSALAGLSNKLRLSR